MTTVGELYHADTMLVAPYHIWELISRIDTVATWAPEVVTCAVVENGLHPTAAGCVRRTLLKAPVGENGVLREVLESTIAGPNVSTLRLRHLQHDVPPAQYAFLHQSLLSNWTTTWALYAVPNDPNKTFVAATMEYEVMTVGDVNHREADAVAVADTVAFLSRLLKSLHQSLSDYVISVAYPMVQAKVSIEHHLQYERFEDAVVRIAARSDIPQDVSTSLEVLLQTWVREAKNSQEKDILIHHLRQEIAAARTIVDSLAATAQSEQPLHIAPNPQMCIAEETGPQAPDASPVEAQQTQLPPVAAPLEPQRQATPTEVLRSQGLQDDKAVASSPYAPPPPRLDPISISKVVENGRLNEDRARRAFQQLDRQRNGWLSSAEVVTLLSSVEHFGLFEDKDGTIARLEAARTSSQQPVPTLSHERQEAERGGENDMHLTPRQKEQQMRQGNEARRAQAMQAFADQWIAKHAKRSGGRLLFEEFCLLLIHLSK